MAAVAILDCRIRKILLADSVRMAQTHQYTKFHQNWSFRCGDIVIFRIFKMAWIRLGHIWTTHSEYLGVSITLQNLVMINAVFFII